MAHFAQIDENNVVVQVLVIDQDSINTGHWGDPSSWIQTSYNTREGIHYGPNGQPDDGIPLRKNYAGINYTYDKERDAFIPPKMYKNWILDEDKCIWIPPIPMPMHDTISYIWDDENVKWVERPIK